MKYKVGQRVKLLLSTNPGEIYMKDCDAEGIIVDDTHQWSLEVKLIQPANLSRWWIDSKHLRLSIQKGQQLLFAFMEDYNE